MIEQIPQGVTQLREDTPENRRVDHALMASGVLDPTSYESGYTPHSHPVEVRTSSVLPHGADATTFIPAGADQPGLLVSPDLGLSNEALQSLFTDPILVDGIYRDAAHDGQRRVLREVRRQANLRTTMGRDQIQRIQMAGDAGTGLQGLAIAYTGTTTTTLTGCSGLPTATSSAGNFGLSGKIILCPSTGVFGVCVEPSGASATVVTVDQWYAMPITVSAGVPGLGTQPTNAAGTAYAVPGAAFASWVGLSTDTGAAAAGSVLRTADGLFAASGNYTTGTATELNANGLVRAFCLPTFGSGTYVLANTWTYSTTGAVTLAKVVCCNSKPAAGSLLMLETLLSATATVTANGDTLAVTWTVTL